jgi:hypothetical protein
MKIANPWVVVFEQDGQVQTHLHTEGRSYEQYGILIADLVRHVANAFNAREEDVWQWVDKERHHQTSPAVEIKPN